MEAILLNASAVFLKWKAPEMKEQHGKFNISTLIKHSCIP